MAGYPFVGIAASAAIRESPARPNKTSVVWAACHPLTTDANTVAAADIAVAALTEAVFDSPLGKIVGQTTGSAIAARRILRLNFCHRAKLSAASMIQFTPRNLKCRVGVHEQTNRPSSV
jgi:hypothetical protein